MKNYLNQKPYVMKTIRHSLAILLVFVILFGLVACGKQEPAETEPTSVEQKPDLQALQTATEVVETEPIVIERELGPQPLLTANEATALTLRYYIYARLKTEELLMADFSSMPEGAFEAQMDELVAIWQTAEALASEAERITDQAVLLLETASGYQLQTQFGSLVSRGSDVPSIVLASYTGQAIDQNDWAENLTKQFDALRGGQRYKQLAEQLGTDTKTAVEQMERAQKIIRDAAYLEEAQAEVTEYTRSINVVEGYKTGSKVGLFVGATIATGGGTLTALAGSSMSVPVAGAVIVGGVDCIVDVGKTTSSIILGEDHQVTVDFEKAGDVIQPVSMVMGLATMDPSSAIDEIAFLGEAMMEWSNPGKITGIAVEITKNGTSRVLAKLISAMEGNLPDVERTLEGLKLSLPKEEGTSLAKLILANTVGSEEAQAKMQELKAQMAQLAGEDVEQSQEEGTLTGEQQEPSTGPITTNGIAGTYSANAELVSTGEGVEAEGSLPVTLQLNESGTGIANVNDFSGNAQYTGNSVYFSVRMTEDGYTVSCVFNGSASVSGGQTSISGTMQCSIMGVTLATYSWTAQK